MNSHGRRDFWVARIDWVRALRRIKNFAQDESGVEAIELAIGMIPLVLLLTGGITYGGVLAAMININEAADEGARAAIAGVTLCERQSLAQTKTRAALLIPAFSAAASINVSVTPDQVRVDVSLPYAANALTPVLFPVPSTLTASAIADTDGPEFPAPGC